MAFAEQTPDFTMKIILLGDTSVGKTCLLSQYVSGVFSTVGQATVGVGYGAKTLEIRGQNVRLQIWDTVLPIQAGQEAFRSITRSFYRGANAACVVYNITSKASYESLEQWIADLRAQSGGQILIYILGNMRDLEEHREVDIKAGKALADRLGVNGFYECSAKTGENVSTAFNALAESAFLAVASRHIPDDQSSTDHNNVTRSIALTNTKAEKQGGCCK
jgi:small GTP-binding protein